MTNKDHLEILILEQLHFERSATRAYLEELAEEDGFTPGLLTQALRSLVRAGKIVKHEIAKPDSKSATHLYADRVLTDAELATHTNEIARRQKLLTPRELRNAGEVYCRALFKRAKHDGQTMILRVPNSKRLGLFQLKGGLRADLIVDLSIRGRCIEGLVECKNERSRFDLNKPLFAKLLRSAHDRGALPILCAAHLSPRALSLCTHTGIAVLHLTRQIVSASHRYEIARIVGPERAKRNYLPIQLERPFYDKDHVPQLARQHLRTLLDCRWFLTAFDRWRAAFDWIPKIATALERYEWNELDWTLQALREAAA